MRGIFFNDFLILAQKITIFPFDLCTFFFEEINSFLEIPIFSLQKLDELSRFIDCFLHHFSLSLLSSHRYYISLKYMSFEFSNRIQELTNKLTQIKQNNPQDQRFNQAKEQLYQLESFCLRELDAVDKRMKKVEGRLNKRVERLQSEQSSVMDIWDAKEDRVSQMIGDWVQDYEQKRQQALQELNREQLHFKTKIEEDEQIYEKEVKMMEGKIQNQLKTLQKEMNKWNKINEQSHNAAIKEFNTYKQAIQREILSSEEMKNKEVKNVESKKSKIKQLATQKMGELKEQLTKYTQKTNHIFQLILDIE